MFWLTRPPYLRWAAAALIFLAALGWDLQGRSGSPYPFAAQSITAGAPITEGDVEWRTMPDGVLTLPDLNAPVATRAIAQGEPILPSAVGVDQGIPNGWWAVSVSLPTATPIGASVRLISTERAVQSEGIVIALGTSDLLSIAEAGLVAVPPEHAAAIATAAAEGTLIVLVAP